MTGAEHDEFLKCRDYILAAFSKEAKRRSRSTGLEWIENERWAVINAANRWADAHARPMALWADVERVESRACGHIDYARKFALYVAELLYAPLPSVLKGTP